MPPHHKEKVMQESTLERYPQKVFVLNGITYVPHRRNYHVFLGPGYPRHTRQTYSAADLVNLGAEEATEFLWPRLDNGVVNEENP
jgi:hypothetical protein